MVVKASRRLVPATIVYLHVRVIAILQILTYDEKLESSIADLVWLLGFGY